MRSESEVLNGIAFDNLFSYRFSHDGSLPRVGQEISKKALCYLWRHFTDQVKIILPKLFPGQSQDEGRCCQMPRECLICGQTREDQNAKLIYDYCPVCLETDVGVLRIRKIQLDRRREKEASSISTTETKEAS